MSQPKNAMEIFRLLDKSNCRECGEKTCLAFAGAVFTGQKSLSQCPKLDPDTIASFDPDSENNSGPFREGNDALQEFQGRVALLDLAAELSIDRRSLAQCSDTIDLSQQIERDRSHAEERGFRRFPSVAVDRVAVVDHEVPIRAAVSAAISDGSI